MKINQFRPVYIISLIVLLLTFALALTMTGSSIKAVKGAQNVIYPIYLDNNESVVGFQVDVNYSTNYLSLQDIQGTSRLPNAQIIFNSQGNIVKIAVLVNNESNKITPGSGAVLNLIFDVSESAVLDNYTVDFSSLVATNVSAVTLDVSEVDGVFEIVEPYNVTFLPPIINFENFTLQDGATLPFKFNVTLNGNFIEDDSVLVRIYNLTLGIDHTYNASGTGNDYISIQGDKYLVNIHTGLNGLNMPKGFYSIEVSFDNYQFEEIGFDLIDKSQGIGKGKTI